MFETKNAASRQALHPTPDPSPEGRGYTRKTSPKITVHYGVLPKEGNMARAEREPNAPYIGRPLCGLRGLQARRIEEPRKPTVRNPCNYLILRHAQR